MKKAVFISLTAVALVILSSCSATKITSEQRAEMALHVQSTIDKRDFKITVDRAIPMRGRNVVLTSSYDLKISGDSVYSHLPYFGRAYQLPYGGGEGLIFKGVMTDYKAEIDRKGVNNINFRITTREDNYWFYLNISPNGNANIRVNPGNKSPISFYGDLEMSKRQ